MATSRNSLSQSLSKDLLSIVNKLHPLERKVLPFLKDLITLDELSNLTGMQTVEVMRALQWLENKGILSIKDEASEKVFLDKNGELYKVKGLPEKRFLQLINDNPKTLSQIHASGELEKDEVNISIGILRKKLAITMQKNDNETLVAITDQGKKLLNTGFLEEKFLSKQFPINVPELKDEDKFAYDNLVKRKGIIKTDVVKIKKVMLTDLGKQLIADKNILKASSSMIDTLTPEMLKTGSWHGKKFRAYDVTAPVPKLNYGKRHFVNQAIAYMKRIWLDMGFTEMTGSFVHTAFKDLDILFVPQDHPARAMQDTFYLKDPAKGKLPEWYKDIKEVHETGGNTGSLGWRTPWSKEIASENLLRTHTTVLSAEHIKMIGEGKLKMPAKFFSVSKVFRNEALDWKHLFEFYQVEGIVVDPDANLKHLKGYLREFFGKMGFTDVRMRPAYFPYTEPSIEVDVYNPEKNTWVELGGAGIFRPEVTKTLIGIEVPVLAWGLGMERIITEYFAIKDLRHLYNNDFKYLRRVKSWMK